MANSSFLPSLAQSDIIQAAQVRQLRSLELPMPDHIQPPVAHTTGLFPCQRWLFRRPASSSTRTLRHPEAIRGMGLGHPLFESRRRQCPVLWCTYRPGQNREGLVGRRHRRRVGRLTRARDTFPPDNATSLRDLVLELTSHSIVSGRSKIILRKLFVAVIRLAFRRTLVCLTGAFRSRRWR